MSCDPSMRVNFPPDKCKPLEDVCYSLNENSCMQLSGQPTFDPMECVGKKFVHKYEDHPVKATIENALGDKKYIVRLGDDREEIMSYGQIIHAMNSELR